MNDVSKKWRLRIYDLTPLQGLSQFLTNPITWISNTYSVFYCQSYAFTLTKNIIKSLRNNFLKGSTTHLSVLFQFRLFADVELSLLGHLSPHHPQLDLPLSEIKEKIIEDSLSVKGICRFSYQFLYKQFLGLKFSTSSLSF